MAVIRGATCLVLVTLSTFTSPSAWAQNPSVSIHLEWTSDATTSPPLRSCAQPGGSVGGTATVRVLFPGVPNLWSRSLAELRITDPLGHKSEYVSYGPFQTTNPATAVCAAPPGTSSDWSIGWTTPNWHNGNHSVTAKVNYTVITGYGPGGPILHDQSATASQGFTLNNLVLTNVTAEPHRECILWDTSEYSSVQLQSQLAAAHRFSTSVTYTIYNPVSLAEVRSVTRPVTCPGTDTFTWDGTDSAGQAVERGVYVYTLNTPFNSGGQGDIDKSDFLDALPGPDPPTLVSATANEVVVEVGYSLASIENRAASTERIKVYDPGPRPVLSHSLGTADLTPGNHRVRLTLTGELHSIFACTFLVSVDDQHEDFDRAHRVRIALQPAQQVSFFPTTIFAFSDIPTTATANSARAWLQKGYWANNVMLRRAGNNVGLDELLAPTPAAAMKLIKPGMLPQGHYAPIVRINKMAKEAWHSLWYSQCDLNQMSIWAFYGHGYAGQISGHALQFSNDSLLISDHALVDQGLVPQQFLGKTWSISRFAPGALSRVYLAVLAACRSGQQPATGANSVGIAGMLRNKGVEHVVSFNRDVSSPVVQIRSDYFWPYLLQGSYKANPPLRNWMHPMTAANHAQAAVLWQTKQRDVLPRVVLNDPLTPFVVYNGVPLMMDDGHFSADDG